MILVFPESRMNQKDFSQLNGTKNTNPTNLNVNESFQKPNNIVHEIL